MSKKNIIVLVGPSGSGKTTIGEALTTQGIPKLVTTTSREPRELEKNGIDYHFCSIKDMNPADFVEQTIYNGNRYGLTKKEVNLKLKKYDAVHVSLDQQGAEAIKRAYPKESTVVFIPINQEQMIERMKQRGDSLRDINERLEHSQETGELLPPPDTDFVIENIEVSETAQKIINKVLKTRNLI